MKFHLSTGPGHLFTAHGKGYVQVDRQEYRESLLVTPDAILSPWGAASVAALQEGDFLRVADLAPQVVIVGTGERLEFPAVSLLRPLIAAGIGYEVMDTAAACRTFNVLCAEGRRVAAAVLIAPDPRGGAPGAEHPSGQRAQ